MAVSLLTPVQDVYVSSAYPNDNFIREKVLFAGSFVGISDIYRSFLKFDLSDPTIGITNNSIVKYAYLGIPLCRNDNRGMARLNAYNLFYPFDQDIICFNSMPTSSYPHQVVLQGPIIAAGSSEILALDITGLVRGWTAGRIRNNGLELRGLENSNDNILGFNSTRCHDKTLSPYLAISWS